MDDQQVEATAWSWLHPVAAPWITTALTLVLIFASAESYGKPRIRAAEAEGQKVENPQPTPTPGTRPPKAADLGWQVCAPLDRVANPGENTIALFDRPANPEEKKHADQLFELRREEQRLLTKFADEHPQVIAVRRLIAQLSASRDVQTQGSTSSQVPDQVAPKVNDKDSGLKAANFTSTFERSEPSVPEFSFLGRAQGGRTADTRSPAVSDYHCIQQYLRCEQTYIFGLRQPY
jgi:hypothetical protein